MAEYAIGDNDLWVLLGVLNRLPVDEAHLRIREAIAYGRRTVLLSGDGFRSISFRWISLDDDADALLLCSDLRTARYRASREQQRAIDRIVSQLQ
jgi:hypothetical protein